jgi:hypothetical protein
LRFGAVRFHPNSVSAAARGPSSRAPVFGSPQLHIWHRAFLRRHLQPLPELDRGVDILLTVNRGVILFGCLFAPFCPGLEVERLGQALRLIEAGNYFALRKTKSESTCSAEATSCALANFEHCARMPGRAPVDAFVGALLAIRPALSERRVA